MNLMKRVICLACACWPVTTWADGNLVVGIADGTLYIVGDQEENQILVSEFGGSLMVAGRARYDDLDDFRPWMSEPTNFFLSTYASGSDINNLDEPFICDSSLVSEIVVIAGGSADRCLLRGDVTAKVTIDGGAGQDWITTYSEIPLTSALGMDINTGPGKDFVYLIDFTSIGSVDVSTGNLDDQIYLDGVNVDGDLLINTGAHDDWLALGTVEVNGNVLVQTGQGADTIYDPSYTGIIVHGLCVFEGGQGFDHLELIIEIDDPALLQINSFEFVELW